MESEDFIYQYEGHQRDVMFFFHNWLTAELGLTSKISYKIPFYYRRSWICYLNPGKDGRVELAFTRGNELSNNQGILESFGRKQVCSVMFDSVSDIPMQEIKEIIHEAILLDESTPYASKRKSGK